MRIKAPASRIIRGILWIALVSSMILYIVITATDFHLMTSISYHSPLAYLIAVTLVQSAVLCYVLFCIKSIINAILSTIITLTIYSMLTVSVNGSSVFSNYYENIFFPLVIFNHTQTDSNADFELSECEVSYFFYDVKNRFNHKRIFRGASSIAVPHLCDKSIDSPSYDKNAESLK